MTQPWTYQDNTTDKLDVVANGTVLAEHAFFDAALVTARKSCSVVFLTSAKSSSDYLCVW